MWSSIMSLISLPPPRTTLCEANKSEPPKIRHIETNSEKIWRKFTAQPLVPIGCAATAYFLGSGIQSFRNRDPVRSQKMMRNRIMAQFVTLICFVGYVGIENTDFRMAPLFQDVKKWNEIQKEEKEEKEKKIASKENQSPIGDKKA